jgi:hypothetical protein
MSEVAEYTPPVVNVEFLKFTEESFSKYSSVMGGLKIFYGNADYSKNLDIIRGQWCSPGDETSTSD